MTNSNDTNTNGSRKPTHFASLRHGSGKGATYERIGAGWLNEEKGTLYVKLAGTQVVSEFTLIENKDTEAGA